MNNGLVSIDFFDEMISNPKPIIRRDPIYLDFNYPNQTYGSSKKYTRPGIYVQEFDNTLQPLNE